MSRLIGKGTGISGETLRIINESSLSGPRGGVRDFDVRSGNEMVPYDLVRPLVDALMACSADQRRRALAATKGWEIQDRQRWMWIEPYRINNMAKMSPSRVRNRFLWTLRRVVDDNGLLIPMSWPTGGSSDAE